MRKRLSDLVVGDVVVSWPKRLAGPPSVHFKTSSFLLFGGVECSWDKSWAEGPFLILEIHKCKYRWTTAFEETVFKVLVNESETGYILVRDDWKFRVL
jgi:hypothetical protein